MRKSDSGFTFVELILVIAVLGILSGIVIPRFLKTIEFSRGAQILANMYTCEEAINLYYTKNGIFPEEKEALLGTVIANWPKPPTGRAIIIKNNGSELVLTIEAQKYIYVKPHANDLTEKVGRVTLGNMTVDEILNTSATSLTLSDDG